MHLKIAALHYYPIKSCAGINAASVTLEDMGFAYDRRWMVVSAEDGRFVSQREYPQMALIRPSIEGGELVVAAPRMPELRVELRSDVTLAEQRANLRAVTVWKFQGLAYDEGAEAANWFGSALSVPCRLVKTGPAWIRVAGGKLDGPYLPRVSFADGYAVLLASESSLKDLNARLESPVSMDRFRPNIVVAGNNLLPWSEDSWGAVQLPNSGRTLSIAKPCARCAVTTVDQTTGELTGPEPLRTLSGFRRVEDNKVLFGSNLIYDSGQPPVEIAVGDPIVPVERE